MSVTLSIPERIFDQNRSDISRELLERAAIEGYRCGSISTGRLAEILDLTIDEANAFLKAHKAHSEVTGEDIEEGRKVLDALLSR
jgi:predicted HTH domain antitoxin